MTDHIPSPRSRTSMDPERDAEKTRKPEPEPKDPETFDMFDVPPAVGTETKTQ